jgi:hypothetical protein
MAMGKRYFRSFIGGLSALVILLLCFPAWAIEGQPEIGMTVEMPLKGIYKSTTDQVIQLIVHLRNQGNPFTGEVVLRSGEKIDSQDLSYRQEVTVPSQAEKEISLRVVSNRLGSDRGIGIALIQNGKQVGWFPLSIGEVHQEWVVGVLSATPDAFSFLNLAQAEPKRNIAVRQLKPADFPEDAWELQSLDVLALGDIPAGLTQKQKQAITYWVKSGGILVVSGGKALDSAKAAFPELIPTSNSTIENAKSPIIRELAEYGPVSNVSERMEITKGVSHLLTYSKAGTGTVLILAVDFAKEPFAGWSGNKQLWSKVLSQLLSEGNDQNQNGLIQSQLTEASRMIPGVTPPNLPLISSIWLVYILFIGPILYILLKKKDQREWAWGAIPLVSLMLAVGVYFLGKYQVAKTDVIHTASKVEILDPHLALVKNAASVLMIHGGNYTVKRPQDSLFFANFLGQASNEPIHMKEDGSISFEQVPYLTSQQAYAEMFRTDLGSLRTTLYVEENQLKGAVQNDTAFPLKKVQIHLGSQIFELGDMNQGQLVQVNQPIRKIYLSQGVARQSGQRTQPSRWDQLQTILGNRKDPNLQVLSSLQITALSEKGVPSFDVVDQQETAYYSTLFVQNVQMAPARNGKVIYPYGSLPARVDEASGKWEQVPNGFQLDNGFVNLALKVQPEQFLAEKVEIPVDEASYQPFKIKLYNVKKNEWKPVDQMKPLVLKGEQLQNCLNPQGELMVRFVNPTDSKLILPFPYFQSEGVNE